MTDHNALIKVDPDVLLRTFKHQQEAHALALVRSCGDDEATLILCKRALETMIAIHQGLVDEIALALKARQS